MPERDRARLLVMLTGSTVPEVQVRYGGFDVLFPEHLTTVNGALGQLLTGLQAADAHLGRAARVFKLQ